jgi:hypothetical protein
MNTGTQVPEGGWCWCGHARNENCGCACAHHTAMREGTTPCTLCGKGHGHLPWGRNELLCLDCLDTQLDLMAIAIYEDGYGPRECPLHMDCERHQPAAYCDYRSGRLSFAEAVLEAADRQDDYSFGYAGDGVFAGNH